MNRRSQRRTLLLARVIRAVFVICLAAAVVVGAFVMMRQGMTASAHPSNCQRRLTHPEFEALQSLDIQVTSVQSPTSVTAQDAFTKGSSQLLPEAQTAATAVACQLVLLNAPNVSPPATNYTPIKGQIAWVIMFQSIGSRSHGHSTSTGIRDLYMFFDANTDTYLLSISASQPGAS